MPLTIVGIGASAGGLEAIAELLGELPPATGMAYIVVQHLDPRHESLLAEILGKKTAIPVSVAHWLERRMALRRIDGVDEYRRLIVDDPGELAALYQDFLIR